MLACFSLSNIVNIIIWTWLTRPFAVGWWEKFLTQLEFLATTKPSSQSLVIRHALKALKVYRTRIYDLISKRGPWQNPQETNSESTNCPPNSFSSSLSVTSTYDNYLLGTCLCCQVRIEVTESLCKTEIRREDWLWANTTFYSQMNHLRL